MRKGELTRAAILDVALDLASRDGLEGLTIGLLADKMNMSKSGVFAHFGSREDLQLEVLKLYHQRFEQEVFFPSVQEPRGIARLKSMYARWVKRVYGCRNWSSLSPAPHDTALRVHAAIVRPKY